MIALSFTAGCPESGLRCLTVGVPIHFCRPWRGGSETHFLTSVFMQRLFYLAPTVCRGAWVLWAHLRTGWTFLSSWRLRRCRGTADGHWAE